jgi:serine/threonine protein kinase
MIYLHSKNIIHGDLKGANVLIDDSGKACIADFGLGRIRANATSRAVTKGPVVGTLRFMAPEHMKGNSIKASDVYSFGMMMYEVSSLHLYNFLDKSSYIFQLLTGAPPFHFVPDASLFTMIVLQSTRLERPSEALDDETWDLIWNCSMPKPTDRPTFISIEPALHLLVEGWTQLSVDPEATEHKSADSLSIDLNQLTTMEVRA